MIKIAIIGGTGLLGSNLVRLFLQYDVKAFSRRLGDNIYDKKNNIIDFNNIETELSNYFNKWIPDIIINTVALVNLEKCEEDYSRAYHINCEIAIKIAKIAQKYNSYFIHISTDHYYNDNYKIHNEKFPITLLNNYAKTKYKAEKEISKYNKKYLIVRTNIIGFRVERVKSFFEWLLCSLKNKEKINLYTNFITSPISVNQLGEVLLKCYHKNLMGTYNISSKEVIDKYSFGIKTAKRFEYSIDNINKSIIENNSSNKLQRALSLGLDVSKIEKDLEVNMPTIDKTLDSLYKEYKKYE